MKYCITDHDKQPCPTVRSAVYTVLTNMNTVLFTTLNNIVLHLLTFLNAVT